ncbi:MAG: hypothetical protein QXD62_01590 [Candidatus Woesearchaeota archaeon]
MRFEKTRIIILGISIILLVFFLFYYYPKYRLIQGRYRVIEILERKNMTIGQIETLYEKKQCALKCLEENEQNLQKMQNILYTILDIYSIKEIEPVFYIIPKNQILPSTYEKDLRYCIEITSSDSAEIRTFLCKKKYK